uniref:Uncharacterized protein n=1 Tax=Anguilla anguilla TaxID=7936 RepID=A0A0E9QL55_ANGAN
MLNQWEHPLRRLHVSCIILKCLFYPQDKQ